MAFRLVLNKEIGWFRSIIASGVISVNRKLGHQEQKREACYNQYILICGFKGELSYGVLCGLLWVFMVLHGVLCVTSHANLLHLSSKWKKPRYDLVPKWKSSWILL